MMVNCNGKAFGAKGILCERGYRHCSGKEEVNAQTEICH